MTTLTKTRQAQLAEMPLFDTSEEWSGDYHLTIKKPGNLLRLVLDCTIGGSDVDAIIALMHDRTVDALRLRYCDTYDPSTGTCSHGSAGGGGMIDRWGRSMEAELAAAHAALDAAVAATHAAYEMWQDATTDRREDKARLAWDKARLAWDKAHEKQNAAARRLHTANAALGRPARDGAMTEGEAREVFGK